MSFTLTVTLIFCPGFKPEIVAFAEFLLVVVLGFAEMTAFDGTFAAAALAAAATLAAKLASAAALVALQMAIEKAGSLDKDKVREQLASLDAITFYGPIKFGSNGMNQSRELPIIQVQKGKVVVLYPDAIKQANLQLVK